MLLAAALATACAAREAQGPPPAKEPAAEPRLTEIDALEHDLTVAEQRLNTQLDKKLEAPPPPALDEIDQGADDKKREDLPARSESSVPEGTVRDAEQAETERRWRRAKLATPCDAACRALASMRRSAERICEIAGASDERCLRARRRVESAAERVERAGCACREG